MQTGEGLCNPSEHQERPLEGESEVVSLRVSPLAFHMLFLAQYPLSPQLLHHLCRTSQPPGNEKGTFCISEWGLLQK